MAVLLATATAAEHRMTAKDTLSAIELDRGDVLRFALKNGEERTLELVHTSARVLFTTLKQIKHPEPGAGTLFEMSAEIKFDGQLVTLRRYVASQEAFYEPYVINGVRLWFDAVGDIQEFLNFNHGDCRPNKHARFALQDATLRICPEELLPWFPGERRFIDIADTYNGDDCWLGPYFGADAHGGLDVNQPIGTVNFTPLRLDDHYYFHSLARGQNNNRWRGVRNWSNGEVWKIQTHHLLSILTPEHTPMAAGDPIGLAAGIRIGEHPHSHYNFKVRPAATEGDIDLDPWILFWQIFEDAKHRAKEIHAAMTPLRPTRAGSPVELSAQGSRPGPGRSMLHYSWAFGDGGGSLAERPTHSFARAGVYPVTLTVFDGSNYATTTQHIAVSGPDVAQPALALTADETSWWPRRLDMQDIYGVQPTVAPRTVEFFARAGRPAPAVREVHLRNCGTGTLAPARVRVDYERGQGWLNWEQVGAGNGQLVRLRIDAEKLAGARYSARVTIEVPGALNSEQSFRVSLLVPTHPPQVRRAAVVDNEGTGFAATPGFWVGHRFHRVAEKGHRGFYLLNGRRDEAAFARFTPDLRAARYDVMLADETPFSADARFAVRIRHARGEETRWIEPAVSRKIGTFDFADGMDGFVEIATAGSRGQVCADAVAFAPITPAATKK